ncbi:MAG: DUF4124 domain-containing protein [Sphingorhabdus sp.]|nr:DUF4124 domain-containing protein [Sphingorhabdus sp.]
MPQLRRALLVSVAFVALCPIFALAQYKCLIDGRTTYAERPCVAGSKPMTLTRDTPVTDDDRAQAKEIADKERLLHEQNRAYQRIVDERHRERMLAGPSAKDERKAYCRDLRKQVKYSKDDLDTYRYNEAIIRDALRRQKEAEAALFSDCFGPAYQ